MKETETWLKIITKAWAEPKFKAELLADPNAVLEKYHIKIPDGVVYEIKEDAVKGTRYLVLPPAPPEDGSAIQDAFSRNHQSGDPGF